MTKLKEVMEEKNITISELAKKSDVNKRTLEEYVGGRRKISGISFSKGVSICKVLDVEPKEIIE